MDREGPEVVAVVDVRAAAQQQLDALQGPALNGQAQRGVALHILVSDHLEMSPAFEWLTIFSAYPRNTEHQFCPENLISN